MPKTCCPNCDASIVIDHPRESAMVTCRERGAQLEIISIDPFEVGFPLDHDKDWDDDWESEEGE